MAFEPQKIDTSTINGGNEYNNGDGLQAETINAIIKSAVFTQSLAETQPNIESLDGQGTPSVEIEEIGGRPRFKFSNFNFSGISVLDGDNYDLDFDNLIIQKSSGVYMLNNFSVNMPSEIITDTISNIYLEIETIGSYRDQIKKFTLDWGMFVAERVVRLVFDNFTQTINKQEDSGWITKDLNFLPTINYRVNEQGFPYGGIKPNNEYYSPNPYGINLNFPSTNEDGSEIKVGSKIYILAKIVDTSKVFISGDIKSNDYTLENGKWLEISARWCKTFWLLQVNLYNN